MKKSTVDEIRARFDGDVERFSNLETGQMATIDAEISLEKIRYWLILTKRTLQDLSIFNLM